MRTTVLVLAIIGGLAAGYLGYRWLSDWNANKEQVEAIVENSAEPPPGYAELRRYVTASYVLLGDVLIGLAGGLLAFRRKVVPAGALMLVGVAVPALLAPKSLAVTCLLALAAILAFVGKSRIEATA